MANTGGNKPRSGIVEAKAYSGRTSPSRKEWMGDCADMDAIGTKDPTAQHAKGYDNIVPDGRRAGDRNGVNPAFDSDTSRKGNDAPISKGGGDTTRSPFSDAGKTTPAESDWNPTYTPNKVR